MTEELAQRMTFISLRSSKLAIHGASSESLCNVNDWHNIKCSAAIYPGQGLHLSRNNYIFRLMFLFVRDFIRIINQSGFSAPSLWLLLVSTINTVVARICTTFGLFSMISKVYNSEQSYLDMAAHFGWLSVMFSLYGWSVRDQSFECAHRAAFWGQGRSDAVDILIAIPHAAQSPDNGDTY